MSVKAKNSNWQSLTKNLLLTKKLLLKDKMGLRMSGGGASSRKNDIKGGGGCLKRGVWTVCRFNGGKRAWQERGGGGVFEGVLIPQCTLCHLLIQHLFS